MEKEAMKLAASRMDRRKFVKGAVATTGALATASYVKPELRALGVSRALAVSPGGEEPPVDPPDDPPVDPPKDPPPTSHSCSLSLKVTASASPGKIWGQVCVTNESDDNGSCKISDVKVLIEPKKSQGGFGGGCGDPWLTLVARSSTGGSNPLVDGTLISGPTGNKTCFTLEVSSILIQNISNGTDYRVHVIVSFGPHHRHGERDTQACTTVSV